MRYGSDVIVDWLVALGIRQVAINPGATIRGLHDSLARDKRVETILAMHEETAVGVAHGYWKATGRPMAVFVHDLVGLQHASMALFNATVDRAAMLVVGGAGPRDETTRRPWLDWVHSSTQHASWARDLVKVAYEPSSLLGVRDCLLRGLRAATSAPEGPAYIAVDTEQQEAPLLDSDVGGIAALAPFTPLATDDDVSDVADLLHAATSPVIVVDRPARGACGSLTSIAEKIGVAVVDIGGGFSFPTTHWADQSQSRAETLATADLVIVVEARDVAWALSEVETGTRNKALLCPASAKIVAVGCSALQDVQGVILDELVPTARYVTGDAAAFLDALDQRLTAGEPRSVAARRAVLETRHDANRARSLGIAQSMAAQSPIHPSHLASALHAAISDGPWLLANGVARGWPARLWDFGDNGVFLGRSGGEGLGYGMPASLGAAFAHRNCNRLVVNLQADGDLMYTASALWTAAHHQIPLLTVMHNNGTYGKDELHQHEMARLRERPDDVSHIGIRLDQPPVNFAKLAEAQGVEGIGPINDPSRLVSELNHAARVAREERRPILVDVRCSE